MATIPADFLDFFEKRTTAHFVTLFPDGAPHVAPVWVDYDEDAGHLLVNTERHRQKATNVERDPRVALSMTEPGNPYRYLSVTGEVVEVTTEGAREHIDELARRYTDESSYGNPIESERVLISIRPDRVYTRGE